MHDLPFQSPTQFAALVLTLIAGWLLGMASASGGRKWREAYEEEAGDHAHYRHQAETDLKQANNRVRELEAECERLKQAAAEAPPAPVANDGADGSWRGWFGWGRDNLARISGIDEAREKRLNELGIKTYREIEKMSAEDETALEQRLEMSAGAIAGERWREQAAMLRAGNEDEHARQYG